MSTTNRTLRVNLSIRVREIRLIGANGEQLGILPTEEALRLAEQEGLDLVEVAPTERPPVCKIMDYGKFKYQQSKKTQVARRRQHTTLTKEVKLRPKTEPHDYQFKLRNVQRFLEAGHKAKITILFRGRENARPELGQRMIERITQDLVGLATVEQAPRSEGRTMTTVLAPKPAAQAQKKQTS